MGSSFYHPGSLLHSRFAYPDNLLDISLHLDVKWHDNMAKAELETFRLFSASPMPSTLFLTLPCFVSLLSTYGYLNLSYMVIHSFIIYLPCQKVHSLLAGTSCLLFLAASGCLEHAWHMVDAQNICRMFCVEWTLPGEVKESIQEEMSWGLNDDEMYICSFLRWHSNHRYHECLWGILTLVLHHLGKFITPSPCEDPSHRM